MKLLSRRQILMLHSMLMMGCAHIGEVQSSVWDSETVDACAKAGIPLL